MLCLFRILSWLIHGSLRDAVVILHFPDLIRHGKLAFQMGLEIFPKLLFFGAILHIPDHESGVWTLPITLIPLVFVVVAAGFLFG